LAPRSARQFLSGHLVLRLIKRALANAKPLVEHNSYEIA